MDPELKQLLEENLRLSKENNTLLLKIRNVQFWSQISKIAYWFIIIGITFGAFYFMKPVLENLINVYTGGMIEDNKTTEASGNMDIKNLQQLIKDLQ
jgi:hypothetical protein